MRISRPWPHKAQRALINMIRHIQLHISSNTAPKSMLGHILVKGNPRCARLQGGKHLLGVIPDGGHNPQPCDNYSTHVASYCFA